MSNMFFKAKIGAFVAGCCPSWIKWLAMFLFQLRVEIDVPVNNVKNEEQKE